MPDNLCNLPNFLFEDHCKLNSRNIASAVKNWTEIDSKMKIKTEKISVHSDLFWLICRRWWPALGSHSSFSIRFHRRYILNSITWSNKRSWKTHSAYSCNFLFRRFKCQSGTFPWLSWVYIKSSLLIPRELSKLKSIDYSTLKQQSFWIHIAHRTIHSRTFLMMVLIFRLVMQFIIVHFHWEITSVTLTWKLFLYLIMATKKRLSSLTSW